MEVKHAKLPYLGLPRGVYVIFFARIVNSIGNFVFPFMTLLLSTKGSMGEQQIGKYLLMGLY